MRNTRAFFNKEILTSLNTSNPTSYGIALRLTIRLHSF